MTIFYKNIQLWNGIMDFIEEKLYNLKNNHILFSIFLIILIFSLISSVSASNSLDTDYSNSNAIIQSDNLLTSDNSYKTDNSLESDNSDESENNVLSTNAVYKISSKATSDEIQSIFDNSNSGDTIQFNDREYNNISIVVNKRLNILSTGNSVIHTSDSISTKASDMGLSNSFGFYFSNLASGSVIKGLTLIGNADYGVIVEGGENVTIRDNTVSGGKKAGILLSNSKSSTIAGNTVTKAYDGVVLNHTNRTKISFNKVYSNRDIGLVLENVLLNNVTNNSIYKNGLDGILLKDAKSNRILRNNITYNAISGLHLEGTTTRNIINYNNISSNVVNIYANSLTNGDQMLQNTLMFARKDHENETYVDLENTGAAIVFADDYKAASQGNLLFSHNSIGMNDVWDAKSTMAHPPVNIGANWYFDNDGNYAIGHICPMVFGKAITADELKTLSMGFSSDGKGIFGQLYDGNTPSGAGSFTIDNVKVDGKDYGSAEVGDDGRFDLDLSNLPKGSVVTINISGHVFNITIDDEIISNKRADDPQKDKATDTPENTEKPIKDPLKEGSRSSAKGNGTGSGFGSSNGSGSGEGNFTGSGISVGTLSGQSNQGTGDSGENGGGSGSEGVSAYELLREKDTPAAAKNSQLIAVFAVALVILIIALGYRSKNKDDYASDNENFEL